MQSLFPKAYEVVLRQLEEMPQFLLKSLSGLPDQIIRRKAASDDLSLIEHLCHVRDCDPDLYGLRIRRILHEASPFLEPVNVSVWPAKRNYQSQDVSLVLNDFTQRRAALVQELRAVSEDALCRTGRRADGTEIDVMGVVAQIAEHDWDHKWRVAAILREFSASAVASA
jgi:hypothetical protein